MLEAGQSDGHAHHRRSPGSRPRHEESPSIEKPLPPSVFGGQRCWWVFGGVLLFHPWWVVSSALAGLASGFGMGPGVSLSLWTAVTLFTCFQVSPLGWGSVIGGGVWMLV